MEADNYKYISESETVLTELMTPAYTNFGGKVHGGVILSLMDKVAYVCAAKHADAYCVTASIDAVDFLHPVEVGELVSLMASVNYVGKSSLVIGIRVISENVKNHTVKHTNSSYFTMVALDDDNRPALVPGLILQKPDEIRRFVEAKKRKELKKQYRQELENLSLQVNNLPDGEALKHDRCRILQKDSQIA